MAEDHSVKVKSKKKLKVQFTVLGVVIFIVIVGLLVFFLTRDDGESDATTEPYSTVPALESTPSPPTEPPKVKVEQGILRGEWSAIPDSEKLFASFKGIPFARPPVGKLRFKAPRTPETWQGVRDATAFGPRCLQQGSGGAVAVGSEDCLYLNVYSPRAPENSADLLPVYMWVHGGTFLSGSASDPWYGPEFLVLQDMIVVTINYRLNVFGYLNLDNEDVPGNAGLKDQIAALEWVHRNIRQFGGDPSSITVGGQSAGATSAHLLSILPETKNLVRRVILQSFSALHSTGYNEDHINIALLLGKRLAKDSVSIDNVTQLVMDMPAAAIMEASMPMVEELLASAATEIPYAITPERRPHVAWGEPRTVTGDLEMLVRKNIASPRNMLLGMTNREWLVAFYGYGYAANPSLMDYRIENLFTVIPKNIKPYRDTAEYLNVSKEFDWNIVLDEVREFYFGKEDSSCDRSCLFKFYLDDVVVGVDTSRMLNLRSERKYSGAETYIYRFSVRADYNYGAFLDPAQESAAVHGDDIGYLWRLPGFGQNLRGENLASKTLQRMTNIWGSFVRTGIPSLGEMTDTWQPVEQTICYMDIAKNIQVVKEDVGGTYMPFWLSLYETWRNAK